MLPYLPLYSNLSTTLAPKTVANADEIFNIQHVVFDELDAHVLVLDGFN